MCTKVSHVLRTIQYLQEEIVGGGHCDGLYPRVPAHGAKRQGVAIRGGQETSNGKWNLFAEVRTRDSQSALDLWLLEGDYYSQPTQKRD